VPKGFEGELDTSWDEDRSPINPDGTNRIVVSDRQPLMPQEYLDQGYRYEVVGARDRSWTDYGGGSGDGSRIPQIKKETTPVWEALRLNNPPSREDSSPPPSPAAPDDGALRERADAVERAKQRLADSGSSGSFSPGSSPFGRAGRGLFSEIYGMGDAALERSDRRADVAQATSMLGITETGRAIQEGLAGLDATRVKPSAAKTAEEWLALAKQFSKQIT